MAIEQKFPYGMKVVQVPLSWYRKVTAFLNNLCAGTGLKKSNPTAPSDVTPVEFAIDEKWLNEQLKGAGGAYAAGDGIDATALAQGEIAVDPDKVVTVLEEDSQTDLSALLVGADTDATASETEDQTTWTAGGDKGLVVPEITRWKRETISSYSYYRLYWRLKTLNPNGTVASYSAEQGYIRIRRT